MSDYLELVLAAHRIRERTTDPFMVAVANLLNLCADQYGDVMHIPEAALKVARAYLAGDE